MRIMAVYPGRFHPFHKGHAASFKQLASKFGLENTYLALSEKQEQPKSPFTAGDRAKMAMALGIPKENIISVRNTYGADEYIKRLEAAGIDPNDTALVYGVSGKDMGSDPRFSFAPKKDGSPSYLQPYTDAIQPMTKHGYVITTNVAEFPVAGQSMTDASQIRAAYMKGDDNIKNQILNDLYGKAGKLMKPIFDKNLQLTESIYKKIVALKAKINEAKLIDVEEGKYENNPKHVYDILKYALADAEKTGKKVVWSEGGYYKLAPLDDPRPALDHNYDRPNQIAELNAEIDKLEQIRLLGYKNPQEYKKLYYRKYGPHYRGPEKLQTALRKKIQNIPYAVEKEEGRDVAEGIVLNPSDLIDIFIKGKHKRKMGIGYEDISFPVATSIPNDKLEKVIELLVKKYNVNPNTIMYGPSKSEKTNEELDDDLSGRHAMDFTKRRFMIRQISKATGWDISDIELASDEEIQQAYDQHVKSDSYLEEN